MKQVHDLWRKSNVRLSVLYPYIAANAISTPLSLVPAFLGYDRLDDPKDVAAHPAPTKVGGGASSTSSKPTDSGEGVK